MITLITNLLIYAGVLTVCCGARKVYRFGWSFKHDGYVCNVCEEPV